MKILALDIGAGTEDILLYDNEKTTIENCVKMVLLAPSKIFATKVAKFTELHRDIFVTGDIIGGVLFLLLLKNMSEKD